MMTVDLPRPALSSRPEPTAPMRSTSRSFTRRTALAGGIGAAGAAAALSMSAPSADAAGPAPAGGHHGGHPGGGAPAVHWERGHLFPTFDRAASTVRVGDMRKLDGFDRLLLITLQGLVNRERPELYLIADDVDETWIPDLPARTRYEKHPLDLVGRYRRRIVGAVVYDMDAPDTINLATTIAAQRGAVVATAEQATEHRLKVVEDLRGRFEDDPAAIYAFATDHLWEKSTHKVLVGLPPTHTVEVDGVEWTELLREKERVTDSSNLGTQTVDLAGQVGDGEVFVRLSDSFPEDGWGPALHHATLTVDGEQTADFVPGTDAEAEFLFDG
ncbi:GxGYxYP domain-containing protein, partial [Brachybacterium sp. ACRRE]|uniref:GxGYxYP domain-containing protein n=1 Tax=Brachybacterium sp. ACRRE TaxID=2918184 RepID=UPI0027152E07